MAEAVPTCDWFFDIISPFAYMQWKTRSRFEGRIRLRPVPILLAGLLDHWEQKGPAEIAPKRRHTYRYCNWRAARLGLPFRFPPGHPFNPLAALRLIVALDAREEVVDALFDAVFGEGRDLNDPKTLAAIGGRFGIADVADAIARPEIKQRLRANTEDAIARGVFGVPTVDVGGTLFWGEDATDMLIDYLDDPHLFETPEMQRLAALPVAAARTGKTG